jgi:uncharacterized damage-inducible protein DinB
MDEINKMIDLIEHLPQKLDAALLHLSDEKLDTPIGEGKWTIRQIANHIADANINALTRMKLIATEENPILKPYNQDLWAALPDCRKGSTGPTIMLLKGLHERWVVFLRSLPETGWHRTGIHLENGKVTLSDVLKTYAKHGEAHLGQITAFREKMKW